MILLELTLIIGAMAVMSSLEPTEAQRARAERHDGSLRSRLVALRQVGVVRRR